MALALFGLGSFYAGKITNSGLPKFLQKEKNTNTEVNSPIEKSIPASDVKSEEVIGTSVKLCSNTVYAFQLAYPKDWFTTYDKQEQQCTFFAPYSFVVPASLDTPFVPIIVEVIEPADWQGAVKFASNPNDFQNVISAQNLEIDARPVVKVVAKSTSEGALARNLTKITYLVFDAQHPLIFKYEQTDEKENVQEQTEALEELVGSLKFF